MEGLALAISCLYYTNLAEEIETTSMPVRLKLVQEQKQAHLNYKTITGKCWNLMYLPDGTFARL